VPLWWRLFPVKGMPPDDDDDDYDDELLTMDVNIKSHPLTQWRIWQQRNCTDAAVIKYLSVIYLQTATGNFRLDALALSVIATATWLAGWVAGWVAVTLRYCIKTAKPIGKLFRPSESHITLVFWDPCADTKFQGEPLQRGR